MKRKLTAHEEETYHALKGNLPHMRRRPMRLYSSKSPQQPTEPQETLYLCFLSLKYLCHFVSWWIFFLTLILPSVAVYGPHFLS
jgi:hypothetical protein